MSAGNHTCGVYNKDERRKTIKLHGKITWVFWKRILVERERERESTDTVQSVSYRGDITAPSRPRELP